MFYGSIFIMASEQSRTEQELKQLEKEQIKKDRHMSWKEHHRSSKKEVQEDKKQQQELQQLKQESEAFQGSESVSTEVHHTELKQVPEYVKDRTTFSFDQNQHPYSLFSEYHLSSGDVLDVLFQIKTWVAKDKFKIGVDNTLSIKFVHAPELNETQVVRPDGNISLPYVGDVYVVNKEVEELRQELMQSYNAILKNPELYVVVVDFSSAIKELKADLHTTDRGLSRLVKIRPDGYVTFPLIGDVFVAGKTVSDVNTTINQLYEVYLPGLRANLILEEHAGSFIYVLGQVQQPGAVKILKPVTVAESLALAGSYVQGANLGSVIVLRKHADKIVARRVNVSKELSLHSTGEILYLNADDVVYVPKTWIKSLAEVAQDISAIAFFRGWAISLDKPLEEVFN